MRTICCRVYSIHSPHDRRRTYSLANSCNSLYTSPGLKGQNNSAQGIPKLRDGKNEPKRSPGKGCRGIAEPHFRPKHEFYFINVIAPPASGRADDFSARP